MKTTSPIHVHLENLSSKPPIFALSPSLVRITRRHNRDLDHRVRFTVGEDFADLDRRLQTAQALVTSADAVRDPRFPRTRLAQAAPNLRFLHLIGAGVESVLPLDWVPPRVQLINNSGVHFDKAREFLLMALVALNTRLPAVVWNQRQARWDQMFTPLVRGKTLTVVGLGDLGRAAVAAGRALGLKVTGIRRSGGKVPGVDRVYRPAQIVTALRKADFIVIAAPLTPETPNLMSQEVLAQTKRGVGIVNVGRAGTIDYSALAALLRNGHVSGAILDVLSPEPLPADSVLWSTPDHQPARIVRRSGRIHDRDDEPGLPESAATDFPPAARERGRSAAGVLSNGLRRYHRHQAGASTRATHGATEVRRCSISPVVRVR